MSHKYTSFSSNEFTLVGRLVNINDQDQKLYLKVATTEKYQDQNDKWQENEEFHHLTVFSAAIADKVRKWSRGDLVQIKGRIKSWQEEQGDGFRSGVVLKVKKANRIAIKQG